MVDIEKVKGRAVRLRAEVEQAMDSATESMEAQARGIVDEARGKALEAVAEYKVEARKDAAKAQEQLAELSGKAKTAVTELSPISRALAVAGVVVVLALIGAWFRARRAARAAQRASEA